MAEKMAVLETAPLAHEITLTQASLRRLLRLQARAEGAGMAAQAAIAAAQQQQQALQQALTEECQDEGMTLPLGAEGVPVDIDWRTGVVRLKAGTNGRAP